MTTAAMNRKPVEPSPSSVDVYAGAPHSKTVMRQTQGLIGTVLIAGVAAAYFVSTAWFVVPTIIGMGLLVAGLCGICPMASFVARLPWNRSAEADYRASSGSCCGGRCT